jgi:hypothetical protein
LAQVQFGGLPGAGTAGVGATVEAVTSRVAVQGIFDPVTVRVTTGTVDLDLKEVVRQLRVDLVTGTITAGFTPARGGNYELAVIAGTASPGSGPWNIRASYGQRFEVTAAGGGARLTMTAVTGMVDLLCR